MTVEKEVRSFVRRGARGTEMCYCGGGGTVHSGGKKTWVNTGGSGSARKQLVDEKRKECASKTCGWSDFRCFCVIPHTSYHVLEGTALHCTGQTARVVSERRERENKVKVKQIREHDTRRLRPTDPRPPGDVPVRSDMGD